MRHARIGGPAYLHSMDSSGPPNSNIFIIAATADWLISGSFRSTGLPIFWAGYSGDLFALPMRLAIAE